MSPIPTWQERARQLYNRFADPSGSRNAPPSPSPAPQAVPWWGDTGVVEPPNAPSPEEAARSVKSFAYWYQRIYLGNGVFTSDQPMYHEQLWHRTRPTFPPDLKGAAALDIGCNAGYFSIQAKRLGAGRVVGIESVDDYLRQARACARIWNFDIDYRSMDAHDLPKLNEQFDVVFFTGILYHLKNPLQVLEEVGRVCRDVVIVETEVIPEDPRNVLYVRQGPSGQVRVTECRKGFLKLVEGAELNGDPTNWCVPDTECVLGMLRTAGFKHFSRPIYMSEARLLLIASKQSDSILNLGALT